MKEFEYVLVIVLGLCFGSFANVCILRSLHNESFGGRSHCPSCNKQLAWFDLIPVFSFLLLQGQCRYCKSKIAFQYPLVEAACALIWFAIYLHTDWGISFILYAGFAFFTLMIVVTDYLSSDVYVWMIICGLLIVIPCQLLLGQLQFLLWGVLVAAGICLFMSCVNYLLKKFRGYDEAFGMGDILYIFLLGTAVGPIGVFSVVFGALLLFILICLLQKRPGNRLRQQFPLCPAFGLALLLEPYLPGGFIGTYIGVLDAAARFVGG